MVLNSLFKYLKEPIVLLILSSFGVYLTTFGLRVEHVVIYSLFFYVLLISLINFRLQLPSKIQFSFYLFAIFIGYSFLLWLSKGNSTVSVYILGQIDRFVIPLLVILVVSHFYSKTSSERIRDLIIIAANLILILSSMAASLALLHLITNDGSFLDPVLPAGDALRGTTASRSLTMGRYTGIFGSPFNSGIVYSFSVFGFMYLYMLNLVNSKHYLMLTIIIFGGLLAVSKAFLLGLVFLAIFILLKFEFKSRKVFQYITLFIFVLGGGMLVNNYIYADWDGFGYLMRLFPSDLTQVDDILRLYTANRFTAEGTGTIQSGFELIKEALPLGFGFANIGIVDNAYLEVLLIAGFIGALFLILFFGYYLYVGFKNKTLPEGMFLIIIISYSAIASLGAPGNYSKSIFITVFYGICANYNIFK